MKNVFVLVIVGLLSMVMGCSEEDATTSQDGAPSFNNTVEGPSALVLTELDLGEIKVAFLQTPTEDGSILSIAEIGSAYATSSPMDKLMEQELTYLEIFKALAPNQDAPIELIDAHAQQVVEFNRENDDVLEVTVDLSQPIEKSVAACESWVFELSPNYGWDNRRGINWTSGYKWLPVSDTSNTDWGYFTTRTIALGVCNESSQSIPMQFAWDNEIDGANWSYVSLGNLGGYYYYRYWNSYVIYGNCYSSGGQCVGDCMCTGSGCTLCIPNSYGTRWAINANGTSYHLKTATRYAIIY